MFQETKQQMQETDRIVKQLGSQMGGLHNSFGELAEHLVAPGIAQRFKEIALEAGLYVLVQTGDTMQMEIPDDFAPREW
jgi:hypothetical protein